MTLDAIGLEKTRVNANNFAITLVAKGKPKQTHTTPSSAQMKHRGTNSSSLVTEEVDINDVPIGCRNLLTKGSTQDEISKLSGAAVSTRGRYMTPEDKSRSTPSDRPLYLFVQGQTREMVGKAVDRIKMYVNNAYRNRSLKNHAIVHPKLPNMHEMILNQPPPLMSINAQPPPQVTVFQEKVMIGLEHAPPSFDVRSKVVGPEDSYLQHIYHESGAKVALRGRNSGYPDVHGNESTEPMHILLEHQTVTGLQAAKNLALNLIQTVQQDYAQFQQALAATLPQHGTLMNTVPHQMVASGPGLIHPSPGLSGGPLHPPQGQPMYHQPVLAPAVLQQPPPLVPNMSGPPPAMQMPMQQVSLPMPVSSQPVYVSSATIMAPVVSNHQFSAGPQVPPQHMQLLHQPLMQEHHQYIQASQAQAQPLPGPALMQPTPHSYQGPPPVPQQIHVHVPPPQLQGPPPGYQLQQQLPPAQVQVVQQVAPLRHMVSQEVGAPHTMLVEGSQSSTHLYGEPQIGVMLSAGSSAPQVMSVQLSSPGSSESYVYTVAPPVLHSQPQGTVYTSLTYQQQPQHQLPSNPQPYTYTLASAPSSMAYTPSAAYYSPPAMHQEPPSHQNHEPAQRMLSEAYYQHYVPSLSDKDGAQSNKRKFKEEKDEDIDENILAYQHGRPHEVNLMNRVPPPPPPGSSSPTNGQAHGMSPAQNADRHDQPDGERKLMPPPPPPPPISGNRDSDSRPPPPPPRALDVDRNEMETKKLKEELLQKKDDSYQFGQYTSKPIMYTEYQYHTQGPPQHHVPCSSSSMHRPPPPPNSIVYEPGHYMPPPPPPFSSSGAPPPPPPVQQVPTSQYYVQPQQVAQGFQPQQQPVPHSYHQGLAPPPQPIFMASPQQQVQQHAVYRHFEGPSY